MKRNDVDRSKLSPMMKHYVELKDKYEDVIILYRLGDFYEIYIITRVGSDGSEKSLGKIQILIK